ncbi:AfsR/SARP family transcriptional regulator [Streptomyces cinnamoneus]|uniref:Regulatory protein AfsR n=1 Tax=Streptomyces cinnamoneus TaxID=53446 RepID=A0A918WCH0_STRCJ|nr:BTAD domain-containing putative transcriptional regulator [Streptomyces cinnamoneus]GHC35892.1 regulatory protein AfsR [Streptomyces cinnamoneus]
MDSTHGDELLRFHVLGPVRAERGGKPLALGPPQQRATLAILLLRGGRPLTTAELVDGLWGDAPPRSAADTVQTYLDGLRAELEPGYQPGDPARLLVTTDDGHASRLPATALDAAVFEEKLTAGLAARDAGDLAGAHERLSAGLALWDGTPLATLPGPCAEHERERLTELGSIAREELFGCALALGRDTDVVAGLRALVAEHPLRERSRALLMLALHRAGRQAEALAVFADARRLLAGGPGPELTRMHERVLAGDAALRPPHETPPAVSAPAPAVTDRLPPDVPGFTGREALTAEVRAALTADGGRGVAVAVLSGPGGAGKSTLAVHVARAVRASYPGGRFHLDLRGSGPAPLTGDAALAGLLGELGVADGALPDGTDRRAALYRSLVADRRMLLLLDDARDAGQVLPLLPTAPGSAVLVTGRPETIDLPGARQVRVEAMEEKEALAMLTAAAGPAGAGTAATSARDVAASCGRLPLPLRIAGARLNDASWTPADLAARLHDERHRLDALHPGDPGATAAESAFRVAYDALGPDAARAVRLLALPDTTGLDALEAAAVLDAPDEAAAGALTAELAAAGLLQPLGHGRYRCHDLLKRCARQQSERTDSPPVRDAALLRLLDHHLATAVTALRRTRPDGLAPRHLRHSLATTGLPLAGTAAARAWLQDAHQHLLDTVRQVLALDVPGSLVPAVDLLTVWSRLTHGTARRQDLRAPAREALKRARQHADDASAARILRLLAAPGFGPDTYERAERDLRASLRLAGAADDAYALTAASHDLGVVLLALGRPDEALPLLVRAEEDFRSEGATSSALEAQAHAARAYIAVRRTDEALTAINEAIDRARQLGHGPTLTLVLYEAGHVLLRADRSAAAGDRLREALAGVGDEPRREALLWTRLAECRLERRQHREAVTAAERALAIEAGLGDAYCRGAALAARGRAQLALGEPRLALGSLREAYEVLRRRGAAEATAVERVLDEEFPHHRLPDA